MIKKVLIISNRKKVKIKNLFHFRKFERTNSNFYFPNKTNEFKDTKLFYEF